MSPHRSPVRLSGRCLTGYHDGLHCLQPKKAEPLRPPVTQADDVMDFADAPWILCRECGAPITQPSWRIHMQGSHAHTFFNPHGLMFELLCFSRAPGAEVTGEPSTEFTWFAGYSWQIALCRSCFNHLGWRFATEAASFWGLIQNRLAEPG